MKTNNSVGRQSSLHEATQSVVISRSSFDQNTPGIHTNKTVKTGMVGTFCAGEINNFETEMQVPSSKVFVWGDNTSGQLAINLDTANQIVDPVAISMTQLGCVLQVACGAAHTLFLTSGAENCVYAMGQNSQGQLGLPLEVRAQAKPVAVEFTQTVSEVHCADFASFALLKAAHEDKNDEVYSWGTIQQGVLGRRAQQNEQAAHEPARIHFNQDVAFKVKSMSVGTNHAAIVTEDHQVYVWGDNSCGQLGLEHTESCPTPVLNTFIASDVVQTVQVSCGKSFSFLISGQNEIMVTGRLPFTVQSDQDEELNHIVTFQSIAQFDQQVQILQVESSRFASLIVDPCEDGQAKELFFWGQSPLGVFNELTPLNQLFAGSCEQQQSSQAENASQSFNVKAVRNGLNFCVFVDEDSGMTYQIGAEHMIDPYIDDALVSLSELRDAQFDDPLRFACGTNFVIGESLIPGQVIYVQSSSPVRRHDLTGMNSRRTHSELISAFKAVEEDPRGEEMMSLQLISPAAGSKQSMPRRALYLQSTTSPVKSTPANQSALSFSATKSIKMKHKELLGTFKNLTGCMLMPASEDTTSGLAATQALQLNSARKETRFKEINLNEHEFNMTGGVPRTTDGAQILICDEVIARDNTTQRGHALYTTTAEMLPVDCIKPTDQHLCQDGDETIMQQQEKDQINFILSPSADVVQNYDSSHLLTTNAGEVDENTKALFSPGVSPINNLTKIQDISNGMCNTQQHCWILDHTSSTENLNHTSSEQQARTNQQPLQMYQPLAQKQMQQCSPDNFAVMAPFMPAMIPQGGSPFQTYQNMHPSLMNYSSAGLPVTPRQGMPLAPGLTQASLSMTHPQQSYDQSPAAGVYYEMALRERVESTQLMMQLKESQRQLEKSRKDYARLLSQVDEDQEETAQLKETVRQQETRISQQNLREGEQDLAFERLMAEKCRFESEGRQANKAQHLLQIELVNLQRSLEKYASKSKLQECQTDRCKLSEQELEGQVQKRTKEIYDLTVKLGCLQTENTELKRQYYERQEASEKRLDSSRIIIEQELHEACEQIKYLSEAFSTAQDQLVKLHEEKMRAKEAQREVGVQTKRARGMSLATQTEVEDEIPRFKHSLMVMEADECLSPTFEQQVEREYEMPDLPNAAYEQVYHRRFAQMDQSFEASFSSGNVAQYDSSNSYGDQSLHEFKQLERASKMHRSSIELPGMLNLPIAKHQRSQFVTRPTQAVMRAVKPAKKHNFMGKRSASNNSVTSEPKIIRTMPTPTPRESDTAGRMPTRFSSHNNVMQHAQQAIPLVNANYSDFSMGHLGDPDDMVQKREIINQPFESQEDSFLNFGRLSELRRNEAVPQYVALKSSRRAKSNSEQSSQQKILCATTNPTKTPEVQICREAAKKTRRLRHQRKAEAISKIGSACGEDDALSGIASIGNKSSLTTTPLRGGRSGAKSVKRDGSRLQQPTAMRQSIALKAMLNRIDSEQKFTTASQVDESMMTCKTPNRRPDATMQLQQQEQQMTMYQSNTSRASGNYSAARQRPTQVQHASLSHSHSQANISLGAQRQSVTPRMNRSISGLQGNAPSHLGRHFKNSLSSMNVHQPQQQPQQLLPQQQLSATAKRVAYEQRRKLAKTSIKEMKSSSQRTNANVNRQARAAIASLSNTSIKEYGTYNNTHLQEELPCMELPQQAIPPVVMSLSREEAEYVSVSGSATSPKAGVDSLSREAMLELRKSKTASALPAYGCEEDEDGLPVDQNHLQSMKVKLMTIQSSKQMLESKIKEYESQLMSIAYEPEQSIHFTRESDLQTTPRHTYSTQERPKKRAAFQQIQSDANIMKNNQDGSFGSSFTSSKVLQTQKYAYRDCVQGSIQTAPKRIQAQSSIQPRNHYANQPINKR